MIRLKYLKNLLGVIIIDQSKHKTLGYCIVELISN